MKKLLSLLFASVLAFTVLQAQAQGLPEKFDPRRDAAADLATAVQMAKAGGKRVMVDVGGEWCSWCHILDRFIAADADVRKQRDDNYVWLKVNWSPENKNEALLSQWPKFKGYPHLFVLDAQGKLLHSQDTGDLEDGKSYDKAKMIAFFQAFARK